MATNFGKQNDRINPQLRAIDYSMVPEYNYKAGLYKAQVEVEKDLRLIKEANEAIDEFKKENKERELKNQAIDYLEEILTNPKYSSTADSIGVDVGDDGRIDKKQASRYIDVMGGAQEAVKAVNSLYEENRKLDVQGNVDTVFRQIQSMPISKDEKLEMASRVIPTSQLTKIDELFTDSAPSGGPGNMSIPQALDQIAPFLQEGNTRGDVESYLVGQGFEIEEVNKFNDSIDAVLIPEKTVDDYGSDIRRSIDEFEANAAPDATQADAAAYLGSLGYPSDVIQSYIGEVQLPKAGDQSLQVRTDIQTYIQENGSAGTEEGLRAYLTDKGYTKNVIDEFIGTAAFPSDPATILNDQYLEFGKFLRTFPQYKWNPRTGVIKMDGKVIKSGTAEYKNLVFRFPQVMADIQAKQSGQPYSTEAAEFIKENNL
jgi:hypothetical protein